MQKNNPTPPQKSNTTTFLVAISILGIIYTFYTWVNTESQYKMSFLQIARTIKATIPEDELKKLTGTFDDINKTEYLRLKKSLRDVIKTNTQAKFAYIYTLRNDKIFFIVDSEPTNSKDYSPPGQEYKEANDEDKRPFQDGKELIQEEVKDSWGKWISISIPIKDPKTNQVIAVFGMDFNHNVWNFNIFMEVVKSSILTILLLLIVVFLIRIRAKNTLLNSEIEDRILMEIKLQNSSDFQKSLLDNIAVGLLLIDPQTNQIVNINPFGASIIGDKKEKITGQSCTKYFYPSLSNNLASCDETTETIENHECKLRLHDGSTIPILRTAKRIMVDGVEKILVSFVSILAQKNAEASLLKQTISQKVLMDMASKFINIPLDRINETINQSLKEMGEFVGADRSYIFNYDFERDTTSNEYEWCNTGIEPQIENLQNYPLIDIPDWVERHRSGGIIYIENTSLLPEGPEKENLQTQKIKSLITIPMISGEKCMGFVGFDSVKTLKNYTEKEITLLKLFSQLMVNIKNRETQESELLKTNRYLEHATQKANEMAAEAERANKSKSLFLANMSHEIRTPLNAIIGFSQLLGRDKYLSDTQMEYTTSIIRAGEHLLTLINDILELSKAEAGRIELNPNNIDLYTLLDDIKTIFNERAKAKHLQFTFNMDDELPRFIILDEVKLRQIFVNIIGNAIKFTEAGIVEVRVKHQIDLEHRNILVVEVQDTGPGISNEELGKLFKHFEQTNSGIKKGSGTGLGLALSREIANLMNGEITVNSELGRGSNFTFYVEFKEGLKPENQATKTRRVISLEEGQKRYKILVVDDKEENLDVVRSLLNIVGFETSEARNGEEAISKFNTWHPDLILMDIRMPVMNGYEATRIIKSTERGLKTPIIALTASTFLEDQKKIELFGMQGFIQKPFRENDLFLVISNTLDIKYIYEADEEEIADGEAISSEERIESELKRLPHELLNKLFQTLEKADLDSLIKLIQNIDPQYEKLAKSLMTYALNYDYNYLHQILSPYENEL